MNNTLVYIRRRNEQWARQQARLRSLMQKARVTDGQKEIVTQQPTFNKKRGNVQAFRYQNSAGGQQPVVRAERAQAA